MQKLCKIIVSQILLIVLFSTILLSVGVSSEVAKADDPYITEDPYITREPIIEEQVVEELIVEEPIIDVPTREISPEVYDDVPTIETWDSLEKFRDVPPEVYDSLPTRENFQDEAQMKETLEVMKSLEKFRDASPEVYDNLPTRENFQDEAQMKETLRSIEELRTENVELEKMMTEENFQDEEQMKKIVTRREQQMKNIINLLEKLKTTGGRTGNQKVEEQDNGEQVDEEQQPEKRGVEEQKVEEQDNEEQKTEEQIAEERRVEEQKAEEQAAEEQRAEEQRAEELKDELKIEETLTEDNSQSGKRIEKIADSLEDEDQGVVEDVLRESVDSEKIYTDSNYEANVLNLVTAVINEEEVTDRDGDYVPDYVEIAYGVEDKPPEEAANKVLFRIDQKDTKVPQLVNMNGKVFGKNPSILAVYKPNVDVDVFIKKIGGNKNEYLKTGTIDFDENGRGQFQVPSDKGLSSGKYVAKLIGTDGVSGPEVSFTIADVKMDVSDLNVEEVYREDNSIIQESAAYAAESFERFLGKEVFDFEKIIQLKHYVVRGKINSKDKNKKFAYLTYKSTIFSSVAISEANKTGEYFEIEVPKYIAKDIVHNLTAYVYSPKKNIFSSAQFFQFKMK